MPGTSIINVANRLPVTIDVEHDKISKSSAGWSRRWKASPTKTTSSSGSAGRARPSTIRASVNRIVRKLRDEYNASACLPFR
jgi:hypothetical protein